MGLLDLIAASAVLDAQPVPKDNRAFWSPEANRVIWPGEPETDHGKEDGRQRQALLKPEARTISGSRRLPRPEPGSELDEAMS